LYAEGVVQTPPNLMSEHLDLTVAILDSTTSIETRVQELKIAVYGLLIPQTDGISELESMVNLFLLFGGSYLQLVYGR
jgi:hypothetical protein